jgi:hypothetical protein
MSPGALVIDYTTDLFRSAGVEASWVEGGGSPSTDREMCALSRALIQFDAQWQQLLSANQDSEVDEVFSAVGSTMDCGSVALERSLREKLLVEQTESGNARNNDTVAFRLRDIFVGSCTWSKDQKLFMYQAEIPHIV